MQLRIRGVPASQPLAEFQLTLLYDHLVQPTLAAGTFLGSTGRLTSCLVTYFSGQAVLHCTSSGTQPGATGDGLLAVLTLDRAAGSTPPLPRQGNAVLTQVNDLASGAALVDTSGEPIGIAATRDAYVSVRALEGDVTGDCIVDMGDAQAVMSRSGAVAGSGGYDQGEDFDGDGDIDLTDIQFVFGRFGSTCAVPIPLQPPLALPPLDSDGDGCPDASELGHVPPWLPLDSHDFPDASRDGRVDFSDFVLLLNAWNAAPGKTAWDPRVDFDGSQKVGFGDFTMLLAGWNRRC